jgi:hypothetical protein
VRPWTTTRDERVVRRWLMDRLPPCPTGADALQVLKKYRARPQRIGDAIYASNRATAPQFPPDHWLIVVYVDEADAARWVCVRYVAAFDHGTPGPGG